MNLFYGVAFICLGAVLFRIVFIGARSSRPSKWFNGFVYLSLLVIGILALPLTGLYLVGEYVRSIPNEHFTVVGLLLCAAAVVGTIVYLKPTKRKLAQFKAMKTA